MEVLNGTTNTKREAKRLSKSIKIRLQRDSTLVDWRPKLMYNIKTWKQ
jgi:hypothetical protein